MDAIEFLMEKVNDSKATLLHTESVLLRTFRFLLTPAATAKVDLKLAKTLKTMYSEQSGKKGRDNKAKDDDETAKARAEALAMFGK
eukprot:13369977-Heterocapsa_arctica.AAC.1